MFAVPVTDASSRRILVPFNFLDDILNKELFFSTENDAPNFLRPSK